MFVCHKHKVVFETEQQARPHKNFVHKDDPEEFQWDMLDEAPEGYRNQPLRDSRYQRVIHELDQTGEDRVVDTPAATDQQRDEQEDSDVADLRRVLKSFSVGNSETAKVLTGFRNFRVFREDPNQLDGWLRSQIKDTKLSSYIPMMVMEIFGTGQAAQAPPVYTQPAGPSPGPAYYPQPQPTYGPQPGGYSYGQPSAGGPPLYYPQPQPERTDNRLVEQLRAMQQRLDRAEEERRREREERDLLEQRRETEARFAKMEQALQTLLNAVAQSKASATESTTDTLLKAALDRLTGLESEMKDQAFRGLEAKFETLSRQVLEGKAPETVGRSTEDLAALLGPSVIETAKEVGRDVKEEIRALRQQVLPRAEPAVQEPVQPLTPEELILQLEQAEAEEALLAQVASEPESVATAGEDGAAPTGE